VEDSSGEPAGFPEGLLAWASLRQAQPRRNPRTTVKPIPDTSPRVSPHLTIAGAAEAIDFYGDRVATIHDPFGHRWNIATHVEDLSPEEMGRRAAEAMGGG
jgi:hypothetical protein